MAESITPRLGLPRWTAGTDTPERSEFDAAFQALEQRAAGFLVWNSTDDGTGSPTIARPSAGAAYSGFVSYDRNTGYFAMCYDTTGSGGYLWVRLTGGEVDTHEGAADPHPQYTTDAETNTAIDNRVTEPFVSALGVNADTVDGQHASDFDAAGAAGAVQTNLDAHTGDTTNPHGVTAAQAGAAPANNDYVASTTITTIVELTQAEYDALGSYDASTLYVVV